MAAAALLSPRHRVHNLSNRPYRQNSTDFISIFSTMGRKSGVRFSRICFLWRTPEQLTSREGQILPGLRVAHLSAKGYSVASILSPLSAADATFPSRGCVQRKENRRDLDDRIEIAALCRIPGLTASIQPAGLAKANNKSSVAEWSL
jgi:hypothetical protein